MISEIVIRVIPAKEQRYDTVGDWWVETPTNIPCKLFGMSAHCRVCAEDSQILQIRVSKMGNQYFEALVGRHEMDEALLAIQHGINEKAITDFDKAHPDDDPGTLSEAPYHKEHMTADANERTFCLQLGFDWNEYDAACDRAADAYRAGTSNKPCG